MKEFVISENCEDKKYRITSFAVTESEFNAHEEAINKFNNVTPFYLAFHYLVRNDYDENVMAKRLLDSMEIIGYESLENVAFPELCSIKTMEDQNALLKEKSAKTLV